MFGVSFLAMSISSSIISTNVRVFSLFVLFRFEDANINFSSYLLQQGYFSIQRWLISQRVTFLIDNLLVGLMLIAFHILHISACNNRPTQSKKLTNILKSLLQRFVLFELGGFYYHLKSLLVNMRFQLLLREVVLASRNRST